MAPRTVVGPVLADLDRIGGGNVTLATAFYSAGALSKLNIKADNLHLLVRLNVSSVFEWAGGAIDPVALRVFIERHSKKGIQVKLSISSTAHAKIYKGKKGYFIGSANLSWRAFSGRGDEVLWFEDDNRRKKLMDKTLEDYKRSFRPLSFKELDDYIAKNQPLAKSLAAKLPREAQQELDEDETPPHIKRPARLGDYGDFLNWLDGQKGEAATTIFARANGQGNLSGHIKQGFFGLRQYFLKNPDEMTRLASKNPDVYSTDSLTLQQLSSFVLHRAIDEGAFYVSTWRTYLPENAGGKPKTGGGTSGNLKRMLPLVARYVQLRLQGKLK